MALGGPRRGNAKNLNRTLAAVAHAGPREHLASIEEFRQNFSCLKSATGEAERQTWPTERMRSVMPEEGEDFSRCRSQMACHYTKV